MKLAFMGTPDFSVNAVKEIHKKFPINTIFTQPPRKSNRGLKTVTSSVHQIAKDLNIDVRHPNKLSEDYDFFLEKKFDLVIVAAYGQLIPEKFLKECLFINIHASLLPKWRGAAPIQRSLMNRDKSTGISIMKIEKELDKGPVMLQQEIPIDIHLTHGELEKKLSIIGSDLVVEAIEKIQSNNFEFIEQDHEKASYAKKITKEDEEINWNDIAENVTAKIHALSPAPGSFFNHKNIKLKIFKCDISNEFVGKPGEISLDKKSLLISCKDKSIRVLEIQKPGKKRQKIEEFLRGHTF